MNEISIKYLSDETTETIRSNFDKYTKYLMKYPIDNSWINDVVDGKTYIEKRYQIEDFDLKFPIEYPKNASKEEKKKIDSENHVIYVNNVISLYEHLSVLPKYILVNEQFWLWLMFDKFYAYTNYLMPTKKANDKVLKDHWFFTQGKRRGLFFGVLSREYFRVDLTVDKEAEDPYIVTKFVLENPERFRNLSWRSFSSEKKIVLGALKAEMKIHKEYKDYYDVDATKYYTEIAKKISKIGSVKLLDVIDEKYIEEQVYNYYKKMIEDDIKRKK